jgi:aminoglycoside phosphotransferase (APT) family kinase protein
LDPVNQACVASVLPLPYRAVPVLPWAPAGSPARAGPAPSLPPPARIVGPLQRLMAGVVATGTARPGAQELGHGERVATVALALLLGAMLHVEHPADHENGQHGQDGEPLAHPGHPPCRARRPLPRSRLHAMTTPVAGADPAVIGPYLADALGEPAWKDPAITLIAGGKSNLTYRLDSAAGSIILRRPPLGHVLPTAHDMGREYRVMSALDGTEVPVPRMLHLCEDADVLGQPFYVMERVEGHVVTNSLPLGYADSAADRAALSNGLVDVLATLHAVDPAAVGLAQFGRPEGYLARQLARWGKQWEATRIEGLDQVDALAADLTKLLPVTQRSSIVHGDYRLDNTMLHPAQVGRINAVLDWEMSTLGDPLADLGILLVYWAQEADPELRRQGAPVGAVTSLPGFLTRDEVASGYAERSGLDVTELPWYVAFGFFKLAVVCAGIAMRVRFGAMVGEGFDGYEERVAPLIAIGRATLEDQKLY